MKHFRPAFVSALLTSCKNECLHLKEKGRCAVLGISIWSGGQLSPSLLAMLVVSVAQDLLLPPVSAKSNADPSTRSPNARPKCCASAGSPQRVWC